MVADIGHRYISEGAKGSALEHKKIGRLVANGDHPQAPSRYPRSLSPSPPPPSDLWSILYIRYFLLSIAPICLIYVSFRGHPRQQSLCACLGLAGVHPESTSSTLARNLSSPLSLSPHGRPLDITEDLLLMQTRRYIKTIYFGNAVPQWVRNRALAIK